MNLKLLKTVDKSHIRRKIRSS